MKAGNTGSSWDPVSLPPGQGRAVWLKPPSLAGPGAKSLVGRGRASEGEGARTDAGVDTLIQRQVVALLQVQEEEPV